MKYSKVPRFMWEGFCVVYGKKIRKNEWNAMFTFGKECESF